MDNYEKKYKDALEWARKVMQGKVGFVLDEVLEKFPELKESEDEKIRKGLIAIITDFESLYLQENYSLSREDILAWLEKQGEQKPAEDVEQVDNLHQYLYGNDEKKLTDNIEPKFKIKYAGNEHNVLEVKDFAGVTFYGIEDEPKHIDYVKAENCEIISGYAIKENGSPYPTNPAWSEEDEEMLKSIIATCELAESEDEKVRKWLIDWATACTHWSEQFSVSREQVIAWLEKQKDREKLIKELSKYHAHHTQMDLQEFLEKQKHVEEPFNNTSCTHLSKEEAESKIWKQ